MDEYGYICTAPCPTLDGKGLAHCKCIDPGRAAVCPCGHSARWEERAGQCAPAQKGRADTIGG